MLRNYRIFNSVGKFVLMGALLISNMPLESSTPPPPSSNNVGHKKSSSWGTFKKKFRNVLRRITKFVRNYEEFFKGIGITIAAYATYKMGGKLLSWLFPTIIFKETAQMGDSIIRANRIELPDHTIQQLESPLQGGRQCGYYSLYNAIAQLRAHYQPTSNIAEFLQQSHTKVAEWQAFLRANAPQRPNQEPYADDLNEETIMQLYRRERQPNGILHGLPEGYFFGIYEGAQHLQLELANMMDPLSGAGPEELLNETAIAARIVQGQDAAQAILTAPVAIFILNTGYQGGRPGEAVYQSVNNHWVMLAVTRDAQGRRTYTITDSKNWDELFDLGPTNRSPARQAITLLEQFYNHNNPAQPNIVNAGQQPNNSTQPNAISAQPTINAEPNSNPA